MVQDNNLRHNTDKKTNFMQFTKLFFLKAVYEISDMFCIMIDFKLKTEHRFCTHKKNRND